MVVRAGEGSAGATPSPLLERSLAWALLLPALFCALPAPLGPLVGDPEPELSAAGWTLLLSLPAAFLTLVLRPARGLVSALPLALPLAVGLGWTLLGEAGDTLERDRWLVAAASAAIALFGGARLGTIGRRALLEALFALSILLALGGLVDPSRAGAPQNAGELAEAALPGAAAGLVLALAALRAPLLRVLGLVAFALVLAHAFLAPVLGTALALSTGALFAAAAAWPRARGRALVLALAALALTLVPATTVVLARLRAGPTATAAPTAMGEPTRATPADLGGVEVRLRVWRASLALIADHPLFGVGPGQFAREFPPYRDPLEIERSSHARTLGAETEVEHPHSEPVLIAAELGLVGLAGALLFALGVVLRGVLRLPGEAPATELAVELALGAAVGALLAQAAWNAPFGDDPLAAAAGFALLGTRLGAAPNARGSLARLAAVGAIGAALLFAPRALELVRHGRALVLLGEADAPALRHEQRLIEAALRERPDSVLARGLAARLAERRDEPERALEEWETVLALRPHRVEALVQSGNGLARAGALERAAERYRTALALDPANPAALWNDARAELFLGELARGLAALDRLEERRLLEHARLEGLGIDLVLAGLDIEGRLVLARASTLPPATKPDALWALARESRAAGEERLGDAFEALAQREWAREHAEAGRWHDAVRSYRQCLRLTRLEDERDAARVRLELAAAAFAEGEDEDARARLAGLAPRASDWSALPDWAVEILRERGWSAAGVETR